MTLMKTLLAAALAATLPLGAVAQDFPDDTVTVVIPFTPGGANATIGRDLAEKCANHGDSTGVVENKPGAGSAIGSAYVANAEPNGYTLLFVSATFTTNAATQPNLPFDPVEDLQPIGMGAVGQFVAVAGNHVEAENLADLIETAKSRKVFYGTTGVGRSTHFAGALLADVAGTELAAVHHPGGYDALLEFVVGRLDHFGGSVHQVLSSVQAGTGEPLDWRSRV